MECKLSNKIGIFYSPELTFQVVSKLHFSKLETGLTLKTFLFIKPMLFIQKLFFTSFLIEIRKYITNLLIDLRNMKFSNGIRGIHVVKDFKN